MMRKSLSMFVLMLLVISCGPSRHAIHVEMRHPSRSGLELAGKNISVVYVSGRDQKDDKVSENMADKFSKSLEESYGTGEGSVGLYCVDTKLGDYSERDSLLRLIGNTGADVVFLMDVVPSGDITQAGKPVKVNLYCYDGMDQEDRVRKFAGTRVLSASSDDELYAEAAKAGEVFSESFKSQWKQEQYSIAYYDSAQWYEAFMRAEQFDWKGATEIWISLLETKDMMKKAAAEYNIAVACYMMGDLQLAEDWLDRSDEDNQLPTLSDALRTRIEARKH